MTLQSYDWLLTAHHADDQMETMLMKMVREGRLQNASGIKRKQPFGNGYLIRPFLTIAKEEIRDYARRRGIAYFEDETNQQTLFQRNRLRHQAVPLLKAENPRALDHFQQLSQEMIYADQLIKSSKQIGSPRYFMRKLKAIFKLDELAAFTAAERYYFLKVCYRKFPMIKESRTILNNESSCCIC